MSERTAILEGGLVALGLALCVLVLASGVAAQEAVPEVRENGYGGSGSVFFDAAETEDGYVLAGNTEIEDGGGTGASADTVGWVVKTNRSGGVVWRETFENRTGSSLYGVTRTDDGYVAVGMYDARSLLNLRQAWAVGLSESGELEWIADSFQGRDRFDDVVSVGEDDGATVAVGTGMGRQQYAVRFDGAGEVVWQRVYGDGNLRSATRSGLVVAGKGERDYGRIESAQVTNATAEGDAVWQRFYEETAANFRQGNPGGEDIVALEDGYAVASGEQLLRTGLDGDPRWTTELSRGGTISALAPTQRGDGVWAAVKIGDNPGIIGPGEARGRLLRVNESGVQRSLGVGLEGELGQIREILPLSDGYYHLSGVGPGDQRFVSAGYTYTADLRPPEVGLNVTPASGEVGRDTVTLRANATDNGNIVEYRWDVDGDNETERVTKDPRVTHTYSEIGTYEANVTAVDESANRDTAVATVEVVDTTSPTADLAAPDPRRVGTDTAAVLDANATDNGNIVEYRWDFGADGGVDTVTQSPRVTHAFSGEPGGSVPLELTVVDAAGNEDSRTVEFDVVATPELSVTTERISSDSVSVEAAVEGAAGTPTVRWTNPEGETTFGTELNYTARERTEGEFRVVAEDDHGSRVERNVTVEFGTASDGTAGGGMSGDGTEDTDDTDDTGTENASDRDDTDGSGPGLGVGGAMVALCGLGYLLRRRVSDRPRN
jgi:hypothetical protein